MSDAQSMDRVLVVDDSRAIQAVLRARIERVDGVATEGADSLAQTDALLADNPERFLLAVLDLNLPDAQHGEVVDAVQQRGVPVIVLTGTVDQQLRETMFAKRIMGYEIKKQGVGIDHIVDMIARIRYYRDSKILVVDDSAAFRSYLESLLQRRCYQTLGAASGPEALRILKGRDDIAMVITDYIMPGMDGATLVLEMRKLRSRKELAIIGISSANSSQISVALLKNGANDFIANPFEVEEFYSRVDQNLDMIRYVREAHEAASRDFLTNLYNRRYFFSIAQTMYANALRGNLHLAAAMLDIDHFKRINDTYGHDIGDLVLVQVAEAINKVVRKSDLVARFGGEEFACLIVVKHVGEARRAFERIRRAIEYLVIRAGEDNIRITISIGVCTGLAESIDGMLNVADQHLYAAKQGGRNRICLDTGPSSTAPSLAESVTTCTG